MQSPLPDYPWQKVATNLFKLNGTTYLIAVDHFSRYPEVIQLRSMTSVRVISALRTFFAHQGIPEKQVSDSGPQFRSTKFTEFATTYGFKHTTSTALTITRGKWPGRKNGKNSKENTQYISRPLYSSVCILSKTTLMVWSVSSWTTLKKTSQDIHPADKEESSTQLALLESVKRGWQAVQRKAEEEHWQVTPCQTIAWTTFWHKGMDNYRWIQKESIAEPCTSAPRSYTVSTDGGTIRRSKATLTSFLTQTHGHPLPLTQPMNLSGLVPGQEIYFPVVWRQELDRKYAPGYCVTCMVAPYK